MNSSISLPFPETSLALVSTNGIYHLLSMKQLLLGREAVMPVAVSKGMRNSSYQQLKEDASLYQHFLVLGHLVSDADGGPERGEHCPGAAVRRK